VVILGAVLAIVTGFGFSAAALLQKHEALRANVTPARLLGALVRRWRWLAAILLSVVAWVAQVAALTLAPVALVIPLVGTGTAFLVVGGMHWLGERFGRMELIGVATIAAGGALAAVGASAVPVAHRALPFATQLLLGAVALVAAGVALVRRDGISLGIAAGCLYAGATILSKEVGDRFADHGLHAVWLLVASPTIWELAILAIGGLWLEQAAFQRANAASVGAAITALDTTGPILAGFVLYHERFPAGPRGILLGGGITLALAGMLLLSRHRFVPSPVAATATAATAAKST
jgi:drug/metabolite transporter (DMT)-like permease